MLAWGWRSLTAMGSLCGVFTPSALVVPRPQEQAEPWEGCRVRSFVKILSFAKQGLNCAT